MACVYAVYLACLVWAGGKVYLWAVADVTPHHTPSVLQIWKRVYPELKRSGLDRELTSIGPLPLGRPPYDLLARKRQQPESRDGGFRVLLLGGSVLEQFADELTTGLNRNLRDRGHCSVFNLAFSARTSRDSLLKRQLLSAIPFDVVVVFHGINDVRMNCCEEGLFRNDYSHCQFYRSLYRRLDGGVMTAPDLIHESISRAIGRGEPTPKLLEAGGLIRTSEAFQMNLDETIRITQRAGGRTVIATFPIHLPDNYSLKAFKAGELDYGDGKFAMPAESWGLPHNVSKTVEAHNAAVRSLAAAHEFASLVDLEALLPAGNVLFSDVCHLTQAGEDKAASLIVDAIVADGLKSSQTEAR